jgi:hypothetical protein
MAGKKRVTGLKYFSKLAPLLARLHDDGCARDRAGNRQLGKKGARKRKKGVRNRLLTLAKERCQEPLIDFEPQAL